MAQAKIKSVGDGTFKEAIAKASPEIRKLASATRALLADVMPGVTEVPWVTQGTIGYGVGPKKMSEHFCYIMPHKKHVNLGFFYGADLEDPEGMLEGSGKALRHVKLRTIADLDQTGLRSLVEQASRYLRKNQVPSDVRLAMFLFSANDAKAE